MNELDIVFLPVVKMTNLRFLLGEVATKDLELLQLDVKMVILHSYLDEEIELARLCIKETRTSSVSILEELDGLKQDRDNGIGSSMTTF